LSLVEFKTVEYEGSKQVVASDEIKQQILKAGIRKLERETKVSHHTITRILKGERVRRRTLAKIVKQISFSAESVGRILEGGEAGWKSNS
jgi:predicted transcriptional regulator